MGNAVQIWAVGIRNRQPKVLDVARTIGHSVRPLGASRFQVSVTRAGLQLSLTSSSREGTTSMEIATTARRVSIVRKVGWLGVASMLAVALLAPSAGTRSPRRPGRSVHICHRTGSNSNPYVSESPSVQSSGATEGQLSGGHSNHLGPRLVRRHRDGLGRHYPALLSTPRTNTLPRPELDDRRTGDLQQRLQPGHHDDDELVIVDQTSSSTTTTTTTSSSSSTIDHELVSSTTTRARPRRPIDLVVDQQATSSTEASSTTELDSSSTEGAQTVEGATDVPAFTLPPTDSFGGSSGPSSDNWRILLIVGAALLASVLILSPGRASSRS